MTDTLRQTTLYPTKITLTARDQYNDYSVVYDHKLEVDDPETGYYRQWDLGTNRVRAMAAYHHAVATVHRLRAQQR